ncbi:MAG: hypothetical protein LBO07_04430 [Coriobacteriales bacterium]|jgi:hypothetical protein|nr:hypothetical protein [Coriobacteriales bacterium]
MANTVSTVGQQALYGPPPDDLPGQELYGPPPDDTLTPEPYGPTPEELGATEPANAFLRYIQSVIEQPQEHLLVIVWFVALVALIVGLVAFIAYRFSRKRP